jgi:hypothetical protein
VTQQERRAVLRLTARRGQQPAALKRDVPTGHPIGLKSPRRVGPWRLLRNSLRPLATSPNDRTSQIRRRPQGSFRQPPSSGANLVKFVCPLDAPMAVRQWATALDVSRREQQTGSNCRTLYGQRNEVPPIHRRGSYTDTFSFFGVGLAYREAPRCRASRQ